MTVTMCARARGRSISLDTERQLWAASAGFCERPECIQYLFHAGDNGKVVTLGQLAHVVAASPGGPRADPAADEQLLASFDNLIVVCPTLSLHRRPCGGGVPSGSPQSVETRPAGARALRVARTQVRQPCGPARRAHRLLQFNNAIFRAYGPYSATSDDPLTDAAEVWRREAVEKMVPTNRRIVELLDLNHDLLTPAEQEVAADYRVHADAFEARHLFGVLSASAPRFPDAMNHLLEEDA